MLTDDPLDPTRQRVLFTWWPDRSPALSDGKELAGVYVWVNRLTDKKHADAGLMERVPGTDVWFAEISVPATPWPDTASTRSPPTVPA